MKKTALFLLLLTCAIPIISFSKDIGLGIIIGSPTGFSGNYMLSKKHSIDGALAFDLSGDKNLHFHSSYLWRYPKSVPFNDLEFGWYWGLGGKYRTHDNDRDADDDYRIGARGSIGTNYEFTDVPVEIFAEGSLIMNFLPETDADFDIGIGARYYF